MKYFLFSFFIVLLLATNPATSDVISGTAFMPDGWNFTLMENVMWYDAHVFVALVVGPPPERLLVLCNNYSYIAMLPDSTFEDLLYAPEDSTLYDTNQPALQGTTYVIKTGDGKYAKIVFTKVWPMHETEMMYVYQPDGSRKLFDDVGTETKSWGFIKLLSDSFQ